MAVLDAGTAPNPLFLLYGGGGGGGGDGTVTIHTKVKLPVQEPI
uniref:Uncharacterized protein n=1 Tax=Oryza sativa subsp. japonica TaxID=39947 RepID=H2KWN9_ORYSJ|nr:hypothetical protein LOC_Os12g04864 [Oryza sativa Japonica Group]